MSEDTPLLPAEDNSVATAIVDEVVQVDLSDTQQEKRSIEDVQIIPQELQDLEKLHAGHKHILGKSAVENELYTTDTLMQADELRTNPDKRPKEWDEVVSHTGQELADMEVANIEKVLVSQLRYSAKAVREQLTDQFQDLHNRDIFEMYMQDAPGYIKSQKDGIANFGWSDWISKLASDEQIMNFLQWHNHHMAERQRDPGVQTEITNQKERYKSAVRNAVEDTNLPETALKIIDNIDNLNVKIGDVFDTLMQERGGYHFRGSNDVVVEEGNLRWAAMHEFNHALLGSLPYRWLDEAMTEHLAQSMKYGNFTRIDPNGTKFGAYIEERELMETLLQIASGENRNSGEFMDNLALLIYGYVDNDKDSLDTFNHNLSNKLGLLESDTNVLEKIDLKIEEHCEALIKQGYSDSKAMEQAVFIVRSDILQQPQVIFGAKELVAV